MPGGLWASTAPDFHVAYSAAIAEWQVAQHESPQNLTVGQLSLMFLEHAKKHYRKRGEATSELHTACGICRQLEQTTGFCLPSVCAVPSERTLRAAPVRKRVSGPSIHLPGQGPVRTSPPHRIEGVVRWKIR